MSDDALEQTLTFAGLLQKHWAGKPWGGKRWWKRTPDRKRMWNEVLWP